MTSTPEPLGLESAPLLFDDHGLPTGDLGDRIWPMVCARLEAEVETGGWDQPARLFAVVNPVDTEAHLGDAVRRLDLSDHALDLGTVTGPGDESTPSEPFALAFAVGELGEVGGHPVQELWGQRAPAVCAALVLAFEGWTLEPLLGPDGTPAEDPYAHLPPSKHPRGVEVRTVLMRTRSGQQYTVRRVRGQEPTPVPVPLDGLLPDTLARMLGVPTAPAPVGAGAILGRIALRAALAALAALFAEHPDRAVPAALAPERAAAHAQLRELPAATRAQLGTTLLPQVLTAGIARAAWEATEHGQVGLEPDLGPLVTAAGDGARSPAHRAAVGRAATAAAGRGVLELCRGPQAGQMFPPELTGHTDWLDEGVATRWLMSRTDSQGELLEQVREYVGDAAARAAAALLDQVGWSGDRESF